MPKEKRLIDANALWQQTFICEEPGDFRKAIENAPTVDAVEVVHGRWIRRVVDHERPWYWKEECSICGFAGDADYLYCPNCGAKMDGGNEDGC